MYGRAHRFDPLDEWVRHPQLAEPAGVGQPLLRGLWLGSGVGTLGSEIDHLLVMDTKEGMESLAVQERQMGKGAERTVPHEHVLRTQQQMSKATWAMSWVCQGAASTSRRKPVPA